MLPFRGSKRAGDHRLDAALAGLRVATLAAGLAGQDFLVHESGVSIRTGWAMRPRIEVKSSGTLTSAPRNPTTQTIVIATGALPRVPMSRARRAEVRKDSSSVGCKRWQGRRRPRHPIMQGGNGRATAGSQSKRGTAASSLPDTYIGPVRASTRCVRSTRPHARLPLAQSRIQRGGRSHSEAMRCAENCRSDCCGR